jgi:hypothetical protein
MDDMADVEYSGVSFDTFRELQEKILEQSQLLK